MKELTYDQERALSDAYTELLVATSRLMKGLVATQQAALLKEWAVGAIRSNRSTLLRTGLDDRWIDSVQKPVVALIDEAARLSPEPNFAAQWSSIQFELYQHQDLGQQVFTELQKLRTSGKTPLPVLKIYQRCLSFGLKGQYQGHPQKLVQIAQGLAAEIRDRQPPFPSMSPDLHGARAAIGPAPKLNTAQITLCAITSIALLLLGLFAITHWKVSDTESHLTDINPMENTEKLGDRP